MRLTGHSAGRHLVAAPSLPPLLTIAGVIAGLLLIFELDRVTASAPVQHLYYLPIILAGVCFGMAGSLTVSVIAIILYHLANPPLMTFQYQQSDFVQVVLFLAVALITGKLTHDSQRLRVLAMTDDLTGLHNLRSFEARLRAIIRKARETQAPLSMLVFDVDRLKAINDRYGHLAGAEAVRTVGRLVAAVLPPTAVASRYGGDEFVVALTDCTERRARAIADDLRRKVSSTAPVLAGQPFPAETLSISVGVACRIFDGNATATAAADDESGEALFRAADAALYRAKQSGRNQVSA